MSSAWKKTTSSLLKKASETAEEAMGKIRTQYGKSELKTRMESHASQFNRVLEESGIKSKAKQVASAANDHMDMISGTKLLKLVEERLALQERYNDILATKLEEALNRIKKLEEEKATKVEKI